MVANVIMFNDVLTPTEGKFKFELGQSLLWAVKLKSCESVPETSRATNKGVVFKVTEPALVK